MKTNTTKKTSYAIGDVVEYKNGYWRVAGWNYAPGAQMTGPRSAPIGKVKALILRQDMTANEVKVPLPASLPKANSWQQTGPK